MAIERYTRIRPEGDIGDIGLTNQILFNLRDYWNWALLAEGNHVNITIPTSGMAGGYFSTLKPVKDPSYTDGQIWQSIRKDWVWETGIEFSGNQPISISGVYVNGVFCLPNDSTYSHTINYKLGRIIFDNIVPVTSVITLNYSYKYCQVYLDGEVDFLQEVQFRSTVPSDSHFDQMNSGDFVGHEHKVQLPCIIIEPSLVPRKKGYQLGDGAIIVYPNVLFHVFAETSLERNKIVDMIDLNTPKSLIMYDIDRAEDNDDLPLNFDGTFNSGAKMYPELIEDYASQRLLLGDSEVTARQTHSRQFHTGTVRIKCEVISQDSV